MAFEPEISMYGKFSEGMSDAGLGVDVEGDCLAPDCQPKSLSWLGEIVQSGDILKTVNTLMFSTIRQRQENRNEKIKILKMETYEDDPQAAELEELFVMISEGVITPEEINLFYLCVDKFLRDGLKVWDSSYGNPFKSEEFKNVVMTRLEVKMRSVIMGLGIDGPKTEESSYSTIRVKEFIIYCSKFIRKIVDAAFADGELRNFKENETKSKAVKYSSTEIH